MLTDKQNETLLDAHALLKTIITNFEQDAELDEVDAELAANITVRLEMNFPDTPFQSILSGDADE